MAFCQNCGKELNEGARFCENCGQAVAGVQVQNRSTDTNNENEKVILEAKGSLFGGGTGKIILTNKHIVWTKSKLNFAMVGVFALLTKGDTSVSLETISKLGTWMFLGGGGLEVYTKDGGKYKFGFNSKKDRDTAMAYIQQNVL
jgi:hypothetical protein